MKTERVLHFTISVTDLERSTRFYRDLLGCTVVHQNPLMVFMACGDSQFVLTRMDDHVPPNPPGGTLFHHAFVIARDEFDKAMEEVRSWNIDILSYDDAGHRTFPGRHAYFHDPDGNCVELIDLRPEERTDGPGPESLRKLVRAGT
jgi:catechol 2,3-dioxygenase-like lactoylglutathione lyase family enzyme